MKFAEGGLVAEYKILFKEENEEIFIFSSSCVIQSAGDTFGWLKRIKL